MRDFTKLGGLLLIVLAAIAAAGHFDREWEQAEADELPVIWSPERFEPGATFDRIVHLPLTERTCE